MVYKYRFITIAHNLKLENIKNKGTQIFPGARISNNKLILDETFDNQPTLITLGIHSVDEFYGESSYIYIDGTFENMNSKAEIDEVGVRYTFYYLREVQSFINKLWEIKDNSIYIRDGFLVVYRNEIGDGFTFKASLSEMFSFSSGEIKPIEFSVPEISFAKSNFISSNIDEYDEESFGGKLPNSNHLFKSQGSERFTRAYYFTLKARTSSIAPTKVILYCMALECLFTTSKSEVNHKVAERVAVLLGGNEQTTKELYHLIKKAYNYRSTLVHGQHLKGSEDEIQEISARLDDVIRELIVNKYDVFEKNDKEIDEYFLNLLLNNRQ